MTPCVRALSSVPMIGRAKTPSQSFTTGVESSSMSSCWREITSSRDFWNASDVNMPRRSVDVTQGDVVGLRAHLDGDVARHAVQDDRAALLVNLGAAGAGEPDLVIAQARLVEDDGVLRGIVMDDQGAVHDGRGHGPGQERARLKALNERLGCGSGLDAVVQQVLRQGDVTCDSYNAP